ncbi:MAG: tetratricopeptide repeat protein, partial [Muribaculaceae bacterium]|nr:tetratricopeptide repeat protein [Muribaculaceae bacterium]
CRAQKRYDQALQAADIALEKLPQSQEATAQKGLALFSLGKFQKASELFGEMVMDNPNSPYNYMLQAWAQNDGLKKDAAAKALYKRMLDVDADWSKPSSLRGFSLLFTGKTDQAIKWAEQILRENIDTDGSVNYTAACLYAQAGEAEKALECVESALNKGYANRFNLTDNDDARMNLAPIHGEKLNKLISNYSYIFE